MITRKVILFSSIPIIVVGVYIFLFGLNFPFIDQWAVVGLLEKQHQGMLTISDLFAQHNEHRPFFPRLIWLALSFFNHYNINAQLWVNLLIAIGTFIFFVDRSMKTWRQLGVSTLPYLIPLMALLVFNLGQRESWLQGIQTIMYLGTACVVIGLFLLAENPSMVYFWGAVGMGMVATFSMANGLLFWLIGYIVLIFTSSARLRAIKLILWSICSYFCISFFLNGWQSSGDMNFTYMFTHILEWLVWVLNFLGSPLMTLWHIAWVFGLVSACLYILIIGRVMKTKQWKPFIPYFGIVLFIVLTDFAVSLGRMKFGMPQSVAPRYLTMSVWYWMSLLTLLPVINMKIPYQRVLYLFFAGSLVLLTIGGGWRGYVSIYQRILPAYQAAKLGQPLSDEVLARVHFDSTSAQNQLEFLRKNKLSVYAEQQP